MQDRCIYSGGATLLGRITIRRRTGPTPRGQLLDSMTPLESPILQAIGPPAPKLVTYIARALQVAICGVGVAWIAVLPGGLRFSPKIVDEATGTNDTSGIFNWHPLLMIFAFVGCMGEAVLAYKRPIIHLSDRPARKTWHASLHTVAMVIGIFGLTAVIKSHTLKRPDPMSNFYSVHSFIGLTVCSLFLIQYILGIIAYLAPKFTASNRAAFSALHAFLGLTTFTGGIAAIAIGVQEKTTFVQLVGKPAVTAAVMRLPAVLVVLLGFYAAAVLFHHAPSAATRTAESNSTAIPQRLDIDPEEIPLHSH